MKKYNLWFKIYVLIIVIAVLIFAIIAANVWSENKANTDTPLLFKSDVPDKYYFRYDAGAVISFNYKIRSVFDADEYRITCSGEDITLLSPPEYNTEKTDGYCLKFRAPEHGEGVIDISLEALKNGEAMYDESHSYLYWCSCDLGVFMSNHSTFPELGMAKAQYDKGEITSAEYYYIVRDQGYPVDTELMNMLGRVASDKIEYSGYAAPYIQAVHCYIFNINLGVRVPDINQTVKKIEQDLGVKLGPDAQ